MECLAATSLDHGLYMFSDLGTQGDAEGQAPPFELTQPARAARFTCFRESA